MVTTVKPSIGYFMQIYAKRLTSGGWLTLVEVVLGGDFNLVPNNTIDRLPSRGQLLDDTFDALVSSTNLVDCWRLRNNDTRQYTWFNASNNGQCSRLDYWLIPYNWINNISECQISASPLTDHCALCLTLNNNKSRPTTVWKFNSNLLRNESFCTQIRRLVTVIISSDSSPEGMVQIQS